MIEETKIEKDPGRVAIVEKIAQFEREERWHEDVEDDPPTIPLARVRAGRSFFRRC